MRERGAIRHAGSQPHRSSLLPPRVEPPCDTSALRYVLVWSALFCWPAPAGAEPPSTIGSSSTVSRIKAAIAAPISSSPTRGAAEFSGFALDLVVFDRGGTIMHRLAVHMAPVRPAKTSVKVFGIAEAACGTIGSIPVNDVIHCRDASGDVAGCVDRLSTSSKLAVSLSK